MEIYPVYPNLSKSKFQSSVKNSHRKSDKCLGGKQSGKQVVNNLSLNENQFHRNHTV